ncbi:MAG: hypothetical protein JW757_08435 [Anaerolineales bacterium]|nr:hypothetical protein [Anaerolineales bacterium]
MTEKIKNSRLSFGYWFKLFLIVAFPLHVWGLLMIFRDIEFITERTNLWDAFGYSGYSLLFILVESILLSVIVWALSLLLPKGWGESRMLAVTGSLFSILAGASIVDMAFHAFSEVRISKQYLYGLKNFTATTYALISAAVIAAMVISLLLILKTNKGEKVFTEIFERVSMLGYLYLFLDAAGIAIVILRNLSEKY